MAPIDVLVVGAGPTGLTMACELIRHGLRVRIVDRAAHASTHSKALVIHARTREVFEAMGLREVVEAESQPIVRVRLMYAGRELGGLSFFDLPDTPQPRMLDQSATEAILAGLLTRLGGAVERGRELGRARHRLDRPVVEPDHAPGEVAPREGGDGAKNRAKQDAAQHGPKRTGIS